MYQEFTIKINTHTKKYLLKFTLFITLLKNGKLRRSTRFKKKYKILFLKVPTLTHRKGPARILFEINFI